MSKPAVLAVAFVAVLAIGGCGDSGGDAGRRMTRHTAEAAKAFTEDEYQALLDDSGDAVKKALTSVRGAGSRDGLQTRLERSASELTKAAGELGARPAPAGETDASSAMKALSAAFDVRRRARSSPAGSARARRPWPRSPARRRRAISPRGSCRSGSRCRRCA